MAITINGSGTVTGLSVGGLPDGTVDAGTLATDSVTAVKIPDTVEASLKSGRKNLIINGGFDVWQRGTSGFPASTSHNGFTADRFSVYSITTHATPTKISVTGQDFNNAIRVANINSTNHWLELQQKVEDCEWLIGKEVTLSFWAKADIATISGQVYTNSPNALTYSPTTSWARYSFTYTVTSGSIAANGYMHLNIAQSTSSGTGSNAIEIAQVQLELGSVATDFEHRSYGEELALCQRYYERSDDTATGNTHRISMNKGTTGSSYYWGIPYKVTKRDLADITITQIYNSDLTISFHATASSASHLGVKNATGGSTNTRALAEINWTADAEL